MKLSFFFEEFVHIDYKMKKYQYLCKKVFSDKDMVLQPFLSG